MKLTNYIILLFVACLTIHNVCGQKSNKNIILGTWIALNDEVAIVEDGFKMDSSFEKNSPFYLYKKESITFVDSLNLLFGKQYKTKYKTEKTTKINTYKLTIKGISYVVEIKNDTLTVNYNSEHYSLMKNYKIKK